MRDRLLWSCLLVLIVILVVLRRYITFRLRSAEGFKVNTLNLSACPEKTKEFNVPDGVNCCDGEIVGGKCTNGKPVCTLSEQSGNLPRCVDYVGINSISKGINICPASMPNYFERDGNGYCTKGALNNARTGPVNSGEKTCAVLTNQEERMRDENSCLNQKMMEDMKFSIANVPYEKVIASRRNGIVLGAIYEVNGKFESCLDRDSFERREDATKPGWRSTTDSSAKDYYDSLTFCT